MRRNWLIILSGICFYAAIALILGPGFKTVIISTLIGAGSILVKEA